MSTSISFDELREASSKPASKSKKESFDSAGGDAPCRTDFRMKVALFLLYMIVSSSMFIQHVVYYMGDDMVQDSRNTTNKGTLVQAILLVLGFSLVEYLHSCRII